MGSSSGQNSTVASTQAVRAKSDIGWEHRAEVIDTNGRKILKCLYCGKQIRGGGINRMKQHLNGKKRDVIGCTKVPHDVLFRM